MTNHITTESSYLIDYFGINWICKPEQLLNIDDGTGLIEKQWGLFYKWIHCNFQPVQSPYSFNSSLTKGLITENYNAKFLLNCKTYSCPNPTFLQLSSYFKHCTLLLKQTWCLQKLLFIKTYKICYKPVPVRSTGFMAHWVIHHPISNPASRSSKLSADCFLCPFTPHPFLLTFSDSPNLHLRPWVRIPCFSRLNTMKQKLSRTQRGPSGCCLDLPLHVCRKQISFSLPDLPKLLRVGSNSGWLGMEGL